MNRSGSAHVFVFDSKGLAGLGANATVFPRTINLLRVFQ